MKIILLLCFLLLSACSKNNDAEDFISSIPIMDGGYDIHRIKTIELGLGGHQISFKLDNVQPPNDEVMIFYENFFSQDKWISFCQNSHQWIGIGSIVTTDDKALMQIMYSKERKILVTIIIRSPQQVHKKDGVLVDLVAIANPFLNLTIAKKDADSICPVVY